MKANYTVAIVLAGFLAGVAFFFSAATAVHAEGVTPTPENPTTGTETSASTEMVATGTPTPEPTISSTPEPELSASSAEGGVKSFAVSSPMLLAATPTKAVWFNSSDGVQSYDTFSEAIEYINGGLFPSDGIIHVENIYAGGETGTLSLYYDETKPYPSTAIKGIVGAPLNPDNPVPIIEITQPLWIQSFTGGFTLSNLKFTGINGDGSLNTLAALVSLVDVSGAIKLSNLDIENQDSTGISLLVGPVNGPVTLTNVEVDDNLGGGAYIQTDKTGSITVTNSSFDNNGGINLNGGINISGLVIETTNSNSAVNLNGVSASGNQSTTVPALLVKKSGPLTIKNSMFNHNLGGGVMNSSGGLIPSVQGTVTLDNVTASDNLSLDLVHGGSGIELYTNGAITANNIYATGNLKYGMLLDNYNGLASAIGNISISNSEFSNTVNHSGLIITSRGSVTLSSVISNYNENSSGSGIYIDNRPGTGAVTLNGSAGSPNITSNNGTHGLEIQSRGSIKLNYVTSSENYGDGAYLVNKEGSGTVTITNSSFNNNHTNGLNVLAKNTVSMSGITADENSTGDGVFIDNFDSLAGFGNISLVNIQANINGNRGINVQTMGTITGSGLKAAQNPMGGTFLNNQESTLPKSITLTNGLFNENKSSTENGIGLEIRSKGVTTLTLVGANGNGLDGITCLISALTNCGSVSINNSANPGSYTISGNADHGLNILTNGSVSLNGIFSDGNRVGAMINNYGGTSAVAVSSSHFNNNSDPDDESGIGLDVLTKGKITLTKVSASRNSGFGARLNNENAGAISPVSVSNDAAKLGIDLNGFSENGTGGLVINARGAVTLLNVEASGNTGNGSVINNMNGGPVDVKIANSYFDGNQLYNITEGCGLKIDTMGNIVFNGGSASGNHIFGASLDNEHDAPNPVKTITISNFAFSSNLNGYGLDAQANGVITLTNVSANENSSFGVNVFNQQATSGAGVVIKASNMNANVSGNGLEITTGGTALLDGVTTNNNSAGKGLLISAQAVGLTTKTVTLNRVSASQNGDNGVEVSSQGLININGAAAKGNGAAGMVLDNTSKSITLGVSILSTLGANNFTGNLNGDGLKIISRGAVSLTSVTANNNQGGSGINVDNCWGGAGCGQANVSFSKVTTRLNGEEGVLINTNALTVTMNGLVSLSNGGSGIKITSNNSLAKISLLNSLFMGNIGHGIEIKRPGLLTPFLTGSSYFGNGTAPNLFVHN